MYHLVEVNVLKSGHVSLLIERFNDEGNMSIKIVKVFLKWNSNNKIKEDEVMAITGVSNYNNIYEASYASSRKETVKKGDGKGAVNSSISSKNEAKLSTKAQDYLNNLRSRYGDYDFLIGNSTDDLKALSKSGTKEFSVIFSNEELERMANDEKYANEKMNCIKQAVKMSDEINKKYGFRRAFGNGGAMSSDINKIGMIFDDNGMTSFFADTKSAFVQANTMDELLEKILSANSNNVKMPRNSGSFDYSI